jgi:type II secretion system protein D
MSTSAFLALLAVHAAAAPLPQEATARASADEEERRARIGAEVKKLEELLAPRQDARPPAAAGFQEGGLILRDTTIEAVVELVAIKTNYSYRFMWTEGENLRGGRIYYIARDRELPRPPADPNDAAAVEAYHREWFHLLKKILLVSGFAMLPLKQEKETVWLIKNIGATGAGAGGAAQLPVDLFAEVFEGEFPQAKEYLPGFSFISKHVKLSHISTAEAVEVLTQAIPQQTRISIVQLPSARELRITGYDQAVFRLEEILKKADVRPDPLAMEILNLQNVSANEMQAIVENMMQALTAREPNPAAAAPPAATQQPAPPQGSVRPRTAAGPAAEQFQVHSDMRTNSLIILAEPFRLARLRSIVAQIDQASGRETFQVKVYRPKHIVASSAIPLLSGLFGAQRAGGAAQPQAPRTGVAGIGGGQTGLGTGGFVPTFLQDDATNSIVVVADRNGHGKVDELLKQIDRRRPQVLLKCSVVQLTTSDTFDLGIELAGFTAPREGRLEVGGRTNLDLSSVADLDGDGVPDIVPADLPGGSLFLFKDRVGQILSNLHLNERVSSVKILEEPELIALNNSQAKMAVETNVPVLRNDVTGTGILTTVFSHFEAASTTLSISPHISEQGYVNLGIEVKVEKFTEAVAAQANVPPPKTTRTFTTSLNVPDRYTAVIGGLITNDESESTHGVPLLYKIPILGHLFRRDQEVRTKTSLYVFVTPTILVDEGWGDFGDETRERHGAVSEKGADLRHLTPHPPPIKDDYSLFKFAPEPEEKRRR